MPLSAQLASIFNQQGIAYESIRRPDAESATAKSVLMAIDGRLTATVIPAGRAVQVAKIAEGFGAREVEFADDDELQDVCSECLSGGKHLPFSNFCGLPVVLDAELCRAAKLTFAGLVQGNAIRVQLVDFLKLLQPRVMDVSSAQ